MQSALVLIPLPMPLGLERLVSVLWKWENPIMAALDSEEQLYWQKLEDHLTGQIVLRLDKVAKKSHSHQTGVNRKLPRPVYLDFSEEEAWNPVKAELDERPVSGV